MGQYIADIDWFLDKPAPIDAVIRYYPSKNNCFTHQLPDTGPYQFIPKAIEPIYRGHIKGAGIRRV